MIPKIIHYCWFGPMEMPLDQKNYIEGWKNLMPDFQFKCWTEKEIDIKSFPFVKNAYSAKKYAYVADYTRIFALYYEGGIYIDTDVMLRSSLETFCKHEVFTSYEYTPSRKQIVEVKALLTAEGERKEKGILKRIPGTGLFSALIGSVPKHEFMKDCLDYYNRHSFEAVFSQGLTVPNILAFHAEKYGLKYKNISQHIDQNIVVYDNKVFASILVATKNSIAVHYCAGSWVDRSFINKIKRNIYKIDFIRYLINILIPKY